MNAYEGIKIALYSIAMTIITASTVAYQEHLFEAYQENLIKK